MFIPRRLNSVNINTEFGHAITITIIVCTNELESPLEHGIMAEADVNVFKFVEININRSTWFLKGT